MIHDFKSYLETQFPELIPSSVLVACSGGLDSMVLAHLLNECGITIGLAHCNFSLRGKESDGDQQFVMEKAEEMEVPVYTQVFDTKAYAKEHGYSTQMAARELRYQWFEEIRKDFKYDYIATAHHADDNLETFFINLIRGTGLKGLMGIPARNGRVVRPLMGVTREEIFNYAKSNSITWREDSSNVSREYLRNEIRQDLIPAFKNVSSHWKDSLDITQRHLRSSRLILEDYLSLVMKIVVEKREEGYAINIQKLIELPNYDELLYELLVDFGFTAWKDIKHLVQAQSGKQILSDTHRLIKNRDVILLTELPKNSQSFVKIITKDETQIDVPLKMSFIPTDKMGNIDNKTIYVDSDRLTFPLTLRKWQEGDRFQPFGMKGNKKLSKFFKDEKLSLATKESIWVLLSNNQIVWVVGFRMDDRFKITPDTSKILKIAVKD